jgi:hypothetical protein
MFLDFFPFLEETGKTQSTSPARRDDPSYLTVHYGGPPAEKTSLSPGHGVFSGEHKILAIE